VLLIQSRDSRFTAVGRGGVYLSLASVAVDLETRWPIIGAELVIDGPRMFPVN
jgi:hypothetical protein